MSAKGYEKEILFEPMLIFYIFHIPKYLESI